MRKLFTILLWVKMTSIYAQEVKWNVSLEPQKVFIENNSQFDNRNINSSSPVLFATEDGPVQVLFSKNGLTYLLQKRIHALVDEDEASKKSITHEEMEKREHEISIITDVIQMQWKNANPFVEVTGLSEIPAAYNYKGKSRSIHARAFQKLLYRNLYPNIDVEYTFHKETGIEYTFLIHPGANASVIQMVYHDAAIHLLKNDNSLKLHTKFGDIIDHAPKTYYAGSEKEILSRFVRNGNTISIQLSDYDTTKEVVIDPWTVFPTMSNSNKVFNIESDSSGNAYIYGGDSPYKLQKYNSSGSLQWTFTNGWDSTTYWCGTLLVDRSGNSYITAGSSAEIAKVNTSGNQVWTNSGGLVDEYWSMDFNCDETELIVGGTRLTGLPFPPTGSGRAFQIDMNNGNAISGIKVSNAIPSFLINDPNEIRSLCASPNGNYYFLTLDTIGSLGPALSAINWETQSGYRFGYGSPDYGFTPQGQNIIRATATHIYTADGDSVVMRDINTGAIVAAAAIPGGGHATTFLVPGTLPKNGGFSIDSCGNVFAGSQSNVTMFDANLNFISSTPTPAAVYDVAIGINGDVLACGDGFAVALSIPSCSQIHSACNTAALPVALFSAPNTICPGTCTAFTNLSSNATSYEWYFPGGLPSTSTDINPSNVCYSSPGTYDVTLVAVNASGTDSITLPDYVTVFPYPAPQGIIQSGDTLFANQGSMAYQWFQDGVLIPGATNFFYVVTLNGNYNVVCTDSNGCEVEAAIFDVVSVVRTEEANIPFAIFPNPVTGVLTIRSTTRELKDISIYAMSGNLLLSFPMTATINKATSIEFDVSSLAEGMYWIEIKSEIKSFRKKFIKASF